MRCKPGRARTSMKTPDIERVTFGCHCDPPTECLCLEGREDTPTRASYFEFQWPSFLGCVCLVRRFLNRAALEVGNLQHTVWTCRFNQRNSRNRYALPWSQNRTCRFINRFCNSCEHAARAILDLHVLFRCVCVCAYACLHVCTYVYMYVYNTYIHIYIYIYIFVCM